jgi:hypothetical protein
MDILVNQVHPTVQMFPNNDVICEDDHLCMHIHTHTHSAGSVQSWFDEHEDAFQHLLWPAQLPDLTIIKLLWSVLESTVRSIFPPTSSLKQLEDVLLEEGTI